MFSREVTNDYGSYSKKDSTTILFKGIFDENFIELKTVDPNTATYKVFNCPSQSINFAVKLGSNTYIPQHLFDRLLTAYKENNPYYTIKDLVTIEMDLSKTLEYIQNKYFAEVETTQVTYTGSVKTIDVVNTQASTATITTKSGSVDVTTPAVLTTNTPTTSSLHFVTANQTKALSTRIELAGVTDIQFQFYKNNIPSLLLEENIIKHILFLFDETNTRINGTYEVMEYFTSDGKTQIEENWKKTLRSTDVVKPVTARVTALDDYLRDVQRS